MSEFITILTSDNVNIQVEKYLFEQTYNNEKISLLIEAMDVDENDTVPLMIVSEKYFRYILKFLKLFDEDPFEKISKPLNVKNLNHLSNNGIPEQLCDYINSFTKNELLELTHIADYMICQPLLELCSARIGFEIRKLTNKEIREYFKS